MKNALLSTLLLGAMGAHSLPGLAEEPVHAAASAPAEVLDLSCWYVSLPVDRTGSGKATSVSEEEVAAGYVDSENFYVNEAGDGVTFSSPAALVKLR